MTKIEDKILVPAFINDFKVYEYTFRGSNSYFHFCLPSHKGSTLKEKSICSRRSKFFPFRVDPILKGLHCSGKQKGSKNKLFLFVKFAEIFFKD